MTSVSSHDAEVPSPVKLDFEQRSSEETTQTACRRPDVKLLRRGGRRRSQVVEFRDDVPDNADDDGGRRRVSLKLDAPPVDELDGGTKPTAPEPGPTESVEADKPLSSGWAAALAAASAAGSVRAAAKRRTNVGRTNAFVPPPTRSLFCLSLTNPLRKLTISIVEWKYPFCQQFPRRLARVLSVHPSSDYQV